MKKNVSKHTMIKFLKTSDKEESHKTIKVIISSRGTKIIPDNRLLIRTYTELQLLSNGREKKSANPEFYAK